MSQMIKKKSKYYIKPTSVSEFLEFIKPKNYQKISSGFSLLDEVVSKGIPFEQMHVLYGRAYNPDIYIK